MSSAAINQNTSSIRFFHIIGALKLVRPLGLLSAILSLIILLGYAFDIECLFRPLGNAGTHPLTAIMLFFISIAMLLWRPYANNHQIVFCAVLSGLLAVLRLIEFCSNQVLLELITPFPEQLSNYKTLGEPIVIGSNTATMILCQSVTAILITRKYYFASQLMAFFALGFPFVSLTGYIYGIPSFYGNMAFTTTITAIPIGFSLLLASSHRSILRAILSPWIAGKIARIQIILGYLFPFLLGYIFIIMPKNMNQTFGLFIIVMGMFISVLVSYSAVFQEKIDRSRRKAERRLMIAASTDSLTEIWNRRFFFDSCTRFLERAKRNDEKLSAMMIDIDHFKRVNDNYGHQKGDEVLQIIASAIRKTIRKQDISGRYGGEEFSVLLPNTDLQGAVCLAEKLRQKITELDLPFSESLTVSIGCASFEQGDELTDLLNRADYFLYRAKATGRNRVVAESYQNDNVTLES